MKTNDYLTKLFESNDFKDNTIKGEDLVNIKEELLKTDSFEDVIDIEIVDHEYLNNYFTDKSRFNGICKLSSIKRGSKMYSPFEFKRRGIIEDRIWVEPLHYNPISFVGHRVFSISLDEKQNTFLENGNKEELKKIFSKALDSYLENPNKYQPEPLIYHIYCGEFGSKNTIQQSLTRL